MYSSRIESSEAFNGRETDIAVCNRKTGSVIDSAADEIDRDKNDDVDVGEVGSETVVDDDVVEQTVITVITLRMQCLD